MARRKRDVKYDTRTARLKLAQRREPYWSNLSAGLALGYRKGKTGGSWIARYYTAEHGRQYHAIGPADDTLDAGAIDWDTAQDRAREWLRTLAPADSDEADKGRPYTVKAAVEAYLAFLDSDGRNANSIREARYRCNAFILPKLGTVELSKLTSDRLRRWRDEVASMPSRLRTRRGEEQRHRESDDSEDAKRRRRASANRTWTVLRAALNHAWRNNKVTSDLAWRKVKPFKGVDGVRLRYLQLPEAKRLPNGCEPDFRKLVQGALQTGGRYGQLVALVVSDFNADVGTVRMRSRKGDGTEKVYQVTLTDEGVAFFNVVCAGRAGDDLIFRKADGEAWRKSEQNRPMAEACKRAKIAPLIGFHGLRHTWASHAVMNGVPLMVVAKNLGHSDTRMVEKHYGHLAPSYVADAIRKGAPRFGFKADRKVVAL